MLLHDIQYALAIGELDIAFAEHTLSLFVHSDVLQRTGGGWRWGSNCMGFGRSESQLGVSVDSAMWRRIVIKIILTQLFLKASSQRRHLAV